MPSRRSLPTRTSDNALGSPDGRRSSLTSRSTRRPSSSSGYSPRSSVVPRADRGPLKQCARLRRPGAVAQEMPQHRLRSRVVRLEPICQLVDERLAEQVAIAGLLVGPAHGFLKRVLCVRIDSRRGLPPAPELRIVPTEPVEEVVENEVVDLVVEAPPVGV